MSKLFDLKKKVAIVTGGSKGIGEAVSTSFADLGAHVHIIDIDQENGIKVKDYILSKGGHCQFHNCDLTKHSDVGDLLQSIFDTEGRIDILINNAGIGFIGNVENTSEEDLLRLFNVNVKSIYSCVHFAVPHMKRSGGGSIVNVASTLSVAGIPERFAYSMTKGAVYSMTFSIACDYLEENIRCNAVGPARVHTPFVDGYIAKNYPGKEKEMFEILSKAQPIGRMAKPIEIANFIAYLSSDAASFMTGSYYPIDGGFLRIFP